MNEETYCSAALEQQAEHSKITTEKGADISFCKIEITGSSEASVLTYRTKGFLNSEQHHKIF